MSYVPHEVREQIVLRLQLMRCDACGATAGAKAVRVSTLYRNEDETFNSPASWPDGWVAFSTGTATRQSHLCPACAKERLPAAVAGGGP